ncbi:hypothetical protein JOM56_005938 [Amanita muscaria]
MDRDFQNTQRRSRSASTNEVPQSNAAVTVNQNDEAFLAQLAAMSGFVQLPGGESSFHAPDPLTQSYEQQHLPSSLSHLYEQPIPGPSSQPNLSSFPPASHWPQSYQDLFNNLLSTSAAGPSHATSPAASPGTSIATEPEILDDDRAASEEKRRRNTEASARFRIKKKQRTINLERSVSDLTGRADELEREVADLRRENGWLKEIVMLKGTRFAAFNLAQHLQAMNQNLVNEKPKKSRRSRSLDSRVEQESSEDEEDEAEAADKKGKGKRATKRS